MTAPGAALERLVEIMSRLRAEGGCPWDREQDLRSLRPYLVEETFEVLDEMDRVGYGGPWAPLCEELGDLLFQIVFHAQLASELGEFGMADVCRAISDKITSRHPHVFGDTKASTATQVLENWAKLKAEEKKRKTGREGSVLDGVPTAAPSLVRAERLTEKASRIGFDWPDLAGVRGKLDEELGELDEAISSGKRDEIEHELGDVLFSLANLARFVKTPAEDALRQANHRFTRRFHRVEEGLKSQGVPFGQATLAQMDALWDQAKVEEGQLPRPVGTSRAAVTALVRTAPSLTDVEQFWKKAAPLLGWEWVSARGATGPVLREGTLDVHFVQGPVTGPVVLRVRLPSKAGLAALRASLPDDAEVISETAVRLKDPSGLMAECHGEG
jgi:nucleoside triphosphate diphosphatase